MATKKTATTTKKAATTTKTKKSTTTTKAAAKTAPKTTKKTTKEKIPATAVVTKVDQRTGFIMKSKTYDILKFIAQIVLPALATLWVAISTIWSLPLGDQVEQTITALIVFLDTLLGLTLAKASSDYHKGDA